MAQKVTLVDDLDGSEGATTVQFSIHGKTYEIDLSKANVGKLNKALSKYVEAARIVRSDPRSAVDGNRRQRRASVGKDVDPRQIRAWAAQNKIAVNSRGRIPRDLVDQYKAATAR